MRGPSKEAQEAISALDARVCRQGQDLKQALAEFKQVRLWLDERIERLEIDIINMEAL